MVDVRGRVDMSMTFRMVGNPTVSGQRMTGTPTEVAARLEELAGRLRELDATKTAWLVGSPLRPLIMVVGATRDECRRTARAQLGRDIDADPANADIIAVTDHIYARETLAAYRSDPRLDAPPLVAVVLSSFRTDTHQIRVVVDLMAAHTFEVALSLGRLLTDAAPWPADLTGTGIGIL